MMREYLQQLYDAESFSIDTVKNRRDWAAWRERARKDLLNVLGLARFPARTALKPRVVGTIDRGDFVIEKVVLETQPNFLMTANLYRPKELGGEAPAVLCVHGHTLKGKTYEGMQIRATNYARAGWVALAVDMTGHGERKHIGHRKTFAIVTAGLPLEGVQVWDNMRCVDYLISRPEVDGERIAITGCSGGGNQTMYTAAVDERIAVAAPVCSVSTLRGQIFTNNGIGCQCECIPNLMRYGLENAAVCALVAPRPLLVVAGTKDRTFPVEYTRDADRHLRRFFDAIGHGDRYRYVERRAPHGYPRSMRQLVHAWFDRWFNERAAEQRYYERGPKPLPAEELWCFPGGELPDDSATLGSLAHAAAKRLVRRIRKPRTKTARAKLRRKIRNDVLGGFPKRGPLEPAEENPVTRAGVVRRRVTLTSEPGITIAATIHRPASADGALPCVVRVCEKPGRYTDQRPAGGVPYPVRVAKNTPRRRWRKAKEFLDDGCAVVELETRPLGGDEHVSRAALVYGRPLVGMGAYDITRLVDYLERRPEIDAERISLWAKDLMALPALYALALDERIAGGTLAGLPETYVTPEPLQHPTWTFAAGLLRHADIEHLKALVAPRKPREEE
ncbi:MAG: alpha/beta hydrolase family protein [Planctomycetota bacterium]